MRRVVMFALVAAGTVYVQHGFLTHVSLWGIKSDLTLMLVVFVGLTRGAFYGVLAGFFLGFASDVLSWGVVGVGSFAGTVAGGLVGAYRKKIYERSLVAPPVLTASAVLFKEAINLAVLLLVSPAVNVGAYHLLRVLFSGVVNAAVAVPVFLLYWWLVPPTGET